MSLSPVAKPCKRGRYREKAKERGSGAFEGSQSDSGPSSMGSGLLWGLVTIGLAPP